MPITNPKLQNYIFLKHLQNDQYFPDFFYPKGKQILVELCEQFETQQPQTAEAVYALTHAATIRFNDLEEELNEHGSEIETIAREAICEDIYIIARDYGFELDYEELVAPREW